MTTPEPEPTRETLIARVSALFALVERQRLYIGSMRASRFWRLRDRVFSVAARFGVRADPLPVPSLDELQVERAALGDPYQLFRRVNARTPYELETIRAMAGLLVIRDPFDVVVDSRGRTPADLDATMQALSGQIYPFWNACVIRDGEATGPALEAPFVVRLVAGDRIEPDALLALAIRFHRDAADIVYGDSDVLIGGMATDPHFKPDWSPETILTRDYVGRPCAFRSAVLERCGGLDASGGPGAWYDALLRMSEATERIEHISQVLVQCATVPSSADRRAWAVAVEAALARRGESADVAVTGVGVDVRFGVPGTDRVTVVIPTRDRSDLLALCLGSVFERTRYSDFEVIVVDNGSVEAATRKLFDRWLEREPRRFRVVRDDGAFNFSRLNNRAVRESSGSYIVMLNNDTEVIEGEWMAAMLGQARRPAIGAVGALLLFEDDTIQHAGVVLGGVLGLAGHAYRYLTIDTAHARGALELDTNYLAVTGACLMVDRAKYEAVGGLDESYAVAYNDVDLCARLRHAGYRNVLVPRAKLYHHESKSRGADDTSAKRERGFRESETFRARWPDWSQRDPYYNPNLTLAAEDFSVKL